MNRYDARKFATALLLAGVSLASGCHDHEAIVIRSSQDAAKARIGVMTGSTGEALAKVRFPQANVQSFDDIMNAVAALESEKLDVVLTTFPTAQQVAKKDAKLYVIDENLDQEDTSVAVRKGDTALLNDVNRILEELKADGTLAAMRKRWLKPDLGPYEVPAIELPTHGKPLKVGVSATREPLSFVDAGGSITGHDGELARRIAAKLHRPVEFQDMKFLALIPALNSGKIDLVITGMTATGERRKSVDFSEPYFVNSQVLLAVKPAAKAGAGQEPQSPGGNSAPKANSLQLTSPADLNNKRIGVLLGSAHSTWATQHCQGAQVLEYKSAADVVLAVKTNKVDAALYDAEPLRIALRAEPTLAAMDGNLFSFDVGAGFRKSNTATRDQFNQFLAGIRKSGLYADMLNRWLEQGDTRMPQIDSPKGGGVLRVAVSDVGLPFIAMKDNQLTGLDIELATRFAAALGERAQFSDMDFGSLIASVSSGKSDMLISSVYITDERKKQIAFSDPYFAMGTKVFALKQNLASAGSVPQPSAAPAVTAQPQGSSARMTSAEDLSNKRIGVLLGSVHDAYATEHFPQATILEYKSPSDLLLAVRSGKIDAAIYTRETLQEMLRDDPDLGLLGGNLESYPIATGFRKGNSQLREQFNAFLATIRKNGVYDDMVQRWIKARDTHMPRIENTGANGKIVIGFVSDKGLPFTIIQDNRPVGFDVELAQRFGAYLGRRIEFSDMDFGSLIAAAATGKIDMIVSTLMITEERKRKIDFSAPYYELGSNVFALKKNMVDDQKTEAAPEKPSFLRGIANSFNSNILLEKRYLLIWEGLKTTVIISILAAIFGTLLGALVCFMRMSKRPVLNIPAKAFIGALRGTPVLVLLMVIFYVVFASVSISPVLVAVIAFGMNFAAYSAEIFRTGIQSIDRGQAEAGIAMGFTPVQTFLYIILPQTVQRVLPVYKGEFISLVKMTSIVGYIAVQDLTKASDIIRSRTFDAFFPLVIVAILYFLIAWVLTRGLEYLESLSNSRSRRKGAAQR